MSKFLFSIISLLLLAVSFVSCNEELVMSANFQETAIIYGLLDQSEDVHLIKINRAFIGPGNSLEIAKIPDSSYFKNIEVKIKEVGGSNRTWILEDTIITNKDQNGVFYAPEQKMYYFKTDNATPLNPDATYKLTATIDKGLASEFIVTGETTIVDNVKLVYTNNFRLSLYDQNLYRTSTLTVDAGNAKTVNAKFDIIVNEFVNSTYDSISIPWNINELEASASGQIGFSYNGQTFYDIVKNGVTKNSSITKRNLNAVKITLTGGSNDLYNYILVNKPSSSLSQSKPTFTNLKVNTENNSVIGIFSSRQTVSYYMPFLKQNDSYYRLLDQKSTKELCTGGITTYEYLFCSQHPADISETFHCN